MSNEIDALEYVDLLGSDLAPIDPAQVIRRQGGKTEPFSQNLVFAVALEPGYYVLRPKAMTDGGKILRVLWQGRDHNPLQNIPIEISLDRKDTRGEASRLLQIVVETPGVGVRPQPFNKTSLADVDWSVPFTVSKPRLSLLSFRFHAYKDAPIILAPGGISGLIPLVEQSLKR